MSDGISPDAAWFGKVSTARHGATLGKGATERVVPSVRDEKAWLLVYRDAVVPVGGGRGPQYPSSGGPGASGRTGVVGSASVTLVVVVDAASGKFLFAHTL